MVDGIVSSGRTVDEAIQNGLDTLRLAKEQVDWEVLYEPDTKLFGLIARGAQVRLTPKQAAGVDSVSETESIENGILWVQDGSLHYQPPGPSGAPGVLVLEKGLAASYNGDDVSGRVELTAGVETLELQLPDDQEPSTRLEPVVSDDGLTCTLFLSRVDGQRVQLPDQPRSQLLPIRTVKEIIPAVEPTIDDVKESLQILGISYGIDLQELTPELLSRRDTSAVVARGKAPTEPIDGQIRYLFEQKSPSNLEADRIDHFETGAVVAVQEGAILAERTPSQPGVDGSDVYGNTIPARQPREYALQAGTGAEVAADGNHIVATEAGLPVVQAGVVRVLQIYDLQGDADISTGNIRFQGEVIVRGSVLDRVIIETQRGGVQIFGLVSHARIKADSNITVAKNVVSSQLAAGGITVIYVKVLAYFHALSKQIEDLIKGYYMIRQQVDSTDGKLIKQLVELKFHNLPKKVQELQEYYKTVTDHLDGDLHNLVDRLGKIFFGRGPLDIAGIHEIDDVLRTLQHWQGILSDASRHSANIKARYLQNSELDASGTVEITGKGCYYSRITAAEGFAMQHGVFRGGEINVDTGTIYVKELGGPTGVDTKVRLIHDGTIAAQRVYPNVTLGIQNQYYKTDQELSSVKVLLAGGMLQVFSGSFQVNG